MITCDVFLPSLLDTVRLTNVHFQRLLLTSCADHIDVKAANARGIKIGHTPGVLSDAGVCHFQTKEGHRQ